MKICPETGKPIVELSHSGLATLARCPKLFAFRKVVVNFQESRQESDATAVGSAMHEGIQAFMREGTTTAGYEALGRHHPIELLDKAKASVYSLEASTWTLKHVMENSDLATFALATFVKDGVEIPATEVAFLVVVETETVIFHVRGFIDLILRNRVTNHLMPVDIKTTTPSALGTMQMKYTYDWQTTSYGIPLNALLGNDGPFDTAILGIAMSDRDPEVLMPIYHRHTRDIDAYHFYLLDKCRSVEQYIKANQFPRHPSGCVAYNKPCWYHGYCGAETITDMQLLVNPSKLEGYKIERPFDPVFTVRLEGF